MAFIDEEKETSEAVSSLHKALRVLKEELSLKDRKIQELEDHLLQNSERVWSSCSNRSNNYDRSTSNLNPPEKSVKGWKSEPILSSPSVHCSRTTKISVRLKVPKSDHTEKLLEASAHYFQDVKALKLLMERHQNRKAFQPEVNDDIVNNGINVENACSSDSNDSVEDLLEEAKDFVNIASKQLVTLREWNEIKLKKQRRKTPSPLTKDSETGDNPADASKLVGKNPFIPQKIQDLKLGSKIRAVINGDIRDAIVIELLPRFQSLKIKVFLKDNKKNEELGDSTFDVLLKHVLVSWH
ncbi:unnamed protein product [Lepeophtheirus salmonis]|uniref:(salmon louse) hypothetical protein n=1 Tax=Lepeophtheirus salmonis TaxID=72036 RepID=A0A7R8H112_LEPSM|nr:uncharacterized protein LOC121125220 [Lepeophtheirus salmonis]CAB4056511.1 unnamed protein product [Lepeophtheirus salmonis]CAF2799400.1 unnamed protein product [Lepeophtheirus salmonis]